jgi:DNA invertase Pin-like site-specific DNA recombinase
MKVVGYGRCSTAEQASSGVSIEMQRRAVERTHSMHAQPRPTAGR